MKKTVIFLLFLFVISSLPLAAESPNQNAPDIISHKLKVVLNPENKTIVAEDLVGLNNHDADEFMFSLNKNLNIEEILCNSQPIMFMAGPYIGPEVGETGITDSFQSVIVYFPKGTREFLIRYSGEIYDPVESGKALIHVRGDMTNGLISPDGVYLSSASGWYPDTEKAMATFSIETRVPSDWYVVTQGDLISRNVIGSERVSDWESSIPCDGCVLVANRFFLNSREIAGINCSTYFYNDNPELSDRFFDNLENYLPEYIKLFGDYPYTRFDIAENFFSTGYGMPAYTLLGDRVLMMPFVTAEGSLAHELVHCWWGNYVYPDFDKGNWCEGITYYSTNYYWNVINGLLDKATEFRYTDMLRYTLHVSDHEDYPIREFRTKFTEEDGDIGYGKAGAVFGMLHRMLGDELFFKSLQQIVKEQGGKLTTWDDFHRIFEEVSGYDLDLFFSSWLDNKGAPEIHCSSIMQSNDGKNYIVNMKIEQIGDVFQFSLPIVFHTDDRDIDTEITINSASTDFKFTSDKPIKSFELDPERYVFRKLKTQEIVPCLAATVESKSIIVVLPSGGESDTIIKGVGMGHGGGHPGVSIPPKPISVKKMYEDLAAQIKESGITENIKYDNEITDEDLRNSSLICLGAPRYNSLAKKIIDRSAEDFRISDTGFSIAGTDYNEAGNAVLSTIRNPFNENEYVTCYLGNSPQSVSKADYMFHYRMHSYVVFKDGNSVDRNKWHIVNALKYELGLLQK